MKGSFVPGHVREGDVVKKDYSWHKRWKVVLKSSSETSKDERASVVTLNIS